MIKKGDLVMIVEPKTCCESSALGFTFVADSDIDLAGGCCAQCGAIDFEPSVKVSGEYSWVQAYRLKKIDPPSSGELTGVPLRLKEPA